jgi:hypothetical protein
VFMPSDTASLLRDAEIGGPIQKEAQAQPEEQAGGLCSCFSVRYYQPVGWGTH